MKKMLKTLCFVSLAGLLVVGCGGDDGKNVVDDVQQEDIAGGDVAEPEDVTEPEDVPELVCDPACAEGFTCIDGQCVEDVVDCDPACAEGFTCIEGQCVEDVVDCDPACEEGFDCVEGLCVEKTCDPACTEGFECIKGECVEIVAACDPACEEGFECVEGQCVEKTCDPACTEGFECIKGECVEIVVAPCSAEGNIANLQGCAEGDIDVTVKGATVTYVFDQGYFIQDASGATEVYVGNAWPYETVTVGQVIDIHATAYGNFHGQQEITASDAPVVVGTADVEPLKLDISAGTLPSEDIESHVIKGTGFVVETVNGQNLTVAYGTATGVVFRANEAAESMCPGATFDVVSAIVTQYDDEHRIQAFFAADVTNINTTNCEAPAEADDSNWGFEEGGPNDPPADFVKATTDFTAEWTAEQAHTGTNGCKLTWTSQDNQDFYQGWYMPVTAGQQVSFKVWGLDNDTAGRFRLCLEFYSDTFMSLKKEYSSGYSEDAAEWTQLEFGKAAPDAAAYVRGFVRLYDVTENWQGTSTVFVDDWNVTAQ